MTPLGDACLKSTVRPTVACLDSTLVIFDRQISLVFFIGNAKIVCYRIFIMEFPCCGTGVELNMGCRTCSTLDFLVGALVVLGLAVWTEILAVRLVERVL